ncbi:MAG: hypothetical protein M3403_06050 [Gemmatimonadota bacterium]|nr:hypothetical protein [Gemmatimonadota bacterium]
MSDPPIALISWSHADPGMDAATQSLRADDDLALANALRSAGIDAEVDLYHLHEGVDWTRWGLALVASCDLPRPDARRAKRERSRFHSALGPGSNSRMARRGMDPVVSIASAPDASSDAVVAMLLLAPTAGLGILIRHDEHLLTKFVASAYRRRLGGTATATFVAAIAVASGVSGLVLLLVLAGTDHAATALTAVTISVARYSGERVRVPPAPPSWA